MRCLEYSLEDEAVVNSLYKLYLGELTPVKVPVLKHAMAPERLRVQIAKMLVKSKLAAKVWFVKLPHISRLGTGTIFMRFWGII
jgi:hypothetical protein